MTKLERYAWLSLIGTGLVIVFLQHRFLDGWQIADVSGAHMQITCIIAVAATIALESLAAGSVAVWGEGAQLALDERDSSIERKGDGHAGYFLYGAIIVLILHLLAHETWGRGLFERLEIFSAAGIIFMLLALLYGTHVVKLVSIIVQYRT